MKISLNGEDCFVVKLLSKRDILGIFNGYLDTIESKDIIAIDELTDEICEEYVSTLKLLVDCGLSERYEAENTVRLNEIMCKIIIRERNKI